jgi:hypothetical protein
MSEPRKANHMLGSLVVIFALLLILVWIPMDTDTGILEKVRRKILIGDALAPTIAGLFILIGGGLLLLFERNSHDQPVIDRLSLKFVALNFLALAIGLIIMRYAGPIAVWMANLVSGSELDYRLLRNTVPWKYIGFFLGGSISIAGLIILAEGMLRPRTILVAVLAILAMIAIYDLPFDDLLLPPNGDV